MTREDVVSWLMVKGAGTQKHGRRRFIEHLLGVEVLLNRASDDVRMAGLCHAVYGTMRYKQSLIPLENRQEVQTMIGTYPEELVYEFCTINRPQCLFNGNYEGKYAVDLIQIEIANLIEQGQMEKLAQLIHAH